MDEAVSFGARTGVIVGFTVLVYCWIHMCGDG